MCVVVKDKVFVAVSARNDFGFARTVESGGLVECQTNTLGGVGEVNPFAVFGLPTDIEAHGQRWKLSGRIITVDNLKAGRDKTPNMGLFHATMKWILEKEKDGTKQTDFQQEVFDAYFTHGAFPDQKLLLETAQKIAVGAVVEELFNDTKQLAQMRRAVEKEAREASTKRGVDCVPFFEFDGYPAFSGAQDVRYFVQYLQRHPK